MAEWPRTFRDFRKGKGKAGANAPFTVKPPAPAGQEPGLVPDIPRDITPDELDALSALAAKLDGPIAAAEVAEPKPEEVKAVAEVPAVVVEANVEAAPEPQPEQKIEAKKDVEVAAVVESPSHVEIPVEHTEPAAAVAEAPRAARSCSGENCFSGGRARTCGSG